jgi:AcrR family transcriptional regulator
MFSADRERNPARSRAAILDAAERLFAERGYNATSLSDVGTAAGVSRGTPGYFFGSKAELYEAVLERCFAEVREAVRAGRARTLTGQYSAEAILAGAVSDYFDFLAAQRLPLDQPDEVRAAAACSTWGICPRARRRWLPSARSSG